MVLHILDLRTPGNILHLALFPLPPRRLLRKAVSCDYNGRVNSHTNFVVVESNNIVFVKMRKLNYIMIVTSLIFDVILRK